MAVSVFLIVFMHEAAHAQICREVDGNEPVFALSWEGVSTDCQPISEEAYKLHALNEVIGYSSLSVVVSLWLIAIYVMCSLKFRGGD